jgi:hypothetical protein
MNGEATPCCAICLEPRTEADGWFLLTENRWTDRLKILGWNDAVVSKPGVQAACGAAHVQQLVLHWMATGSLNYPFAHSGPADGRGAQPAWKGPLGAQLEPDTRGSKVLGELAVHRESMERLLREDPQSLGSILAALSSALTHQTERIERAEEQLEEDDVYELAEV